MSYFDQVTVWRVSSSGRLHLLDPDDLGANTLCRSVRYAGPVVFAHRDEVGRRHLCRTCLALESGTWGDRPMRRWRP